MTYHHLAFILPQTSSLLVELHPDVLYDQLLMSVWQTLQSFGADPRRLDG
jgi:hypothetical protein